MVIGVDTSDRKPRRFRGTPAYRFRNYVTLGFLSMGVICGVIFSISPLSYQFRHKSQEFAYTVTEEQKRHAAMMSGSLVTFGSGDRMRKIIDDANTNTSR